jgi:DNA (cytosine-5)-methyltransferase 1
MKIRVADFFCGCGGTSAGLRSAGLKISLGVDIDPEAEETFRHNFPEAEFFNSDARDLRPRSLEPIIARNRNYPLLFSACVPCQPFSRQNQQVVRRISKSHDAALLDQFHRFVSYFAPEYVFLENVPGMQKVSRRTGPFARFLKHLDLLNYAVSTKVVDCRDYGVPQKRQRLVLLASRLGPIDFPTPTHGDSSKPASTVRDWIRDFPPIAAGEEHLRVPNHRARSLSQLNLARIRATPEGGDRRNWPCDLILECHKAYDGHSDVYGRLKWDRPASALTTKCITLSNGRFGHPQQDRAISVREAASLQTFPRDFIFFGTLTAMARQIGNAVPVLMARSFGQAIIRHYARVEQAARRRAWRA